MGLNLRAYFDAQAQPQWLYERVHKHLTSSKEGGAYLRANLASLKVFLTELNVPEAELGYKTLGQEKTEMEPWDDHTVTSRALPCLLFYQVRHRRTTVDAKLKSITLLQTLVSSLPGLDKGAVGLSFQDGNDTLRRVDVAFSSQGVTSDWHRVLSRNFSAQGVWEKLQKHEWCKCKVTSGSFAASMKYILFFLCYLVAHSKGELSHLNPYLSVCKHVLPDLLFWLASLMDSGATRLSAEPLEGLPSLKTLHGTNKRKADLANRFVLLDKIKKHKAGRKRIAPTHTDLAPVHSNLVGREAQTTVCLYLQKVCAMFPDKPLPRQFAISWDPSDYGGKSTMVNTIYSVVADCAAFMPNQRIRRLILADLHDSFIEEAKASKLGTLEGYLEVRALSHALLQATGCSLMDFRVPETLLARPLQDGEARIFINGAWYIVGPGDLVRPELPPGLDISSIPALVSCSDQGPSNTSSLNFLMFGQERLMVQVQYDCFHRGWNDVKLSAKRALGYPWKTMLQLVPLFNMNYAPFQSSAFFYKKQAVLENSLGTRTYKDPSFQAAIPMICKERRISEPECAEEEQELFRSLAIWGILRKKVP